MVESLFWNPAFWCCSSCEMVGNVKRLMEVTPRSIFSSCVILFCPQARDPWRSLDRWRGKTSFLFSLRHCLRGGRTSKTICKNTISASDNQSTHQDFYTIWHKNLSSVYLSKAIHVSSLFSARQQNQPRTASQLSEETIKEQMTAHEKEANDQLLPQQWGFDKFNYHDNWSTLSAGKKVLIVSGWIEDLDCGWMESPRSAAATIWSFRRPKVRTSAPEIMVFFPKSQVFMAFGSNFFLHFSERTKKTKLVLIDALDVHFWLVFVFVYQQ